MAIRIVHRTFAAPPPKALIFLKVWHNYLRWRVPCPGTAQIHAHDRSKPPMKHSSSPHCADCANAAAAPAAQCRARHDLDLPAHAVAAGRLQLPPSADLFGLWRRSDRAFRTVGRRMDDAGAAVALPALGHLGDRQCAADNTAGRAMVSAVAVRTLARRQRAAEAASLHSLSKRNAHCCRDGNRGVSCAH